MAWSTPETTGLTKAERCISENMKHAQWIAGLLKEFLEGRIERQIAIEMSKLWLRGTLLDMSVTLPEGCFQADLLSALAENGNDQATHIIERWIDDNSQDLYFVVCREPGYLRIDRWRNSRVFRISNSLPLSSLDRPETVRLHISNASIVHLGLEFPRELAQQYQNQAWFLKASLRLSATDIFYVMSMLISRGLTWENIFSASAEDLESMIETEDPRNTAIKMALEALYRGHKERRVLQKALSNSTFLDDLSLQEDLSEANRTLHSHWMMVVAFKNSQMAMEKLRTLKDSFFMAWPPDLNCHPQVHISELKICKKEHAAIIAFSAEPRDDMRDRAAQWFLRRLNLKDSSKLYVTQSFRCKDDHGCRGVIRADGMLQWYTKDRLLAYHLRNAIDADATRPRLEDSIEHVASSTLFQPGRAPVDFIIYTRRPPEDTHRSRAIISRQGTWIALSKFLAEAAKPGDRVVFCAEGVSSVKHGLQYRTMMKKLGYLYFDKSSKKKPPTDVLVFANYKVTECSISQQPLLGDLEQSVPDENIERETSGQQSLGQETSKRSPVFLTASPKMLTTRSEEIDSFLDDLKACGGSWYTTGVEIKGTKFEKQTNWYEVNSDGLEDIKNLLDGAYTRAIGTSWYGRTNHYQIIFNDTRLHKQDSFKHAEALRAAIKSVVRHHEFDRVMVIERVSQSPTAKESNPFSYSCNTQHQMSSYITGTTEVEVVTFVGKYESGKKTKFVKRLVKELRESGKKTLVLSPAIDRAFRSRAAYEIFRSAAVEGGHGLISLLWKSNLKIDVHTALGLPESQEMQICQDLLEEQRRAPPSLMGLPHMQPVLCINGNQRLSSQVEDLLESSVQQAGEFSDAIYSATFRGTPSGDDKLPIPVLQPFYSEHGLKKDLARILPECLAGDVAVLLTYGASAYTCKCAEDSKIHASSGSPPASPFVHSAECRCVCDFCKDHRSCPCPAFKTCNCSEFCSPCWGEGRCKCPDHGQCHCPDMCNCSCDRCHPSRDTLQFQKSMKKRKEAPAEDYSCIYKRARYLSRSSERGE